MMTSESGEKNPPTSRRGINTIFFLASAPRSENISNNRRKRGVQRDSANYLRCTTALSRTATQGDQRHTKNHTGNANTRLRSGRTGTRQCSPHQIKLRVNGTVGTDECDHERHADVTKNTRLCPNEPSKAKINSTAGVAGAISLTGEKPAQKRNRDIKRKHTTRKGWVAVKRYVNDGQGRQLIK